MNGNPLVAETVPLRNGDVIELAGTQMQFVHELTQVAFRRRA